MVKHFLRYYSYFGFIFRPSSGHLKSCGGTAVKGKLKLIAYLVTGKMKIDNSKLNFILNTNDSEVLC